MHAFNCLPPRHFGHPTKLTCSLSCTRFLAHWWDPGAVLDATVALWWLQCALALACTLLLVRSGRDQPSFFDVAFTCCCKVCLPSHMERAGCFLVARFQWRHAALEKPRTLALLHVFFILRLTCVALPHFVQPFYMLTHHRYSLESMSAVVLMPLLPCVVAAGSGGIVARQADIGER